MLGRYLNAEKVSNGLRLSLTPEGRELCEELVTQRPDDWVFVELFEDYLGNGWSMISAESLGALTGCQIIVSDDVLYDDEGEVERVGDIYWHERYAVENAAEALLKGSLFLLRA